MDGALQGLSYLSDGFFDATHILRGLEFLAPDKKHYRGQGALLYFNALLNYIFQL